MSRIIRRAIPPAEMVARRMCKQCGSEIEYERSDLWHGDQRDPGSWAKCPVCNETFDARELTWAPKEAT